MNSTCKDCMLNKHTDQTGAVPTGPEVFYEVKALRKRLFGEGEMDYAQIKRHFNALMLEIEPELESRVKAAEDPLKSAVQYAMMGNFIDFAALDKVEESKLMELIDRAPDITVDEDVLEQLRDRAATARTLTLITDNCGEIVMDKILLRQLLSMNPDLLITVIVRGGPVANDATLEDAEQVGLANYETLYGCGYNIFFIFMCKCMLFMDRFKVPQFTGILAYEDPEILFNVYADVELLKRYRFRQILPEEGVQAGEMDRICFPPEEAKPMEIMCRFVGKMPEQFLVAVDRRTGKVAGFLCGISSDEARFKDEFFTDLSLNDLAAQTVYLLGLDILPEYRGQGLARELIKLYGIWSQVKGRHRMVLTAHEEKVGLYEKLGFTDLGISGSTWGGGVWHEMVKPLEG